MIMDSNNANAEPTGEGRKGHKHSKRNFFKSKKNSKNASEEAPLLVDDAPNDIDDIAGTEEREVIGEQPKRSGKANKWFRTCWQWLWSHLMIVSIVALLIGGIIALCVYFAGKSSLQM